MKTKDLEKKFSVLDKELVELKKQNEERKEDVVRLNKLVEDLRRDAAELRDLMEVKEAETRLLKTVVSQYVTGKELSMGTPGGSTEKELLTRTDSSSTIESPKSPFPDELQRKQYTNDNKLDAWRFRSNKFNIEGDFSMQKTVESPKAPISIGISRSQATNSDIEAMGYESVAVDDKWEATEANGTQISAEKDQFLISQKSSSEGSPSDATPDFSRTSSIVSEDQLELNDSSILISSCDVTSLSHIIIIVVMCGVDMRYVSHELISVNYL